MLVYSLRRTIVNTRVTRRVSTYYLMMIDASLATEVHHLLVLMSNQTANEVVLAATFDVLSVERKYRKWRSVPSLRADALPRRTSGSWVRRPS